MFDPIGPVSIALGSVVLDRPDQTGRFFVKDMAGGWAYLVGDAEGDNRFRGQGVCDGGLDTTLRCALLSAINHVPDYRRFRILVETRQAHRMIVHLAKRDPHVIAAIAGRPVTVLTMPEERSSHQVRFAAERAASIALRDRDHAEWQAAEAEADTEAAEPVFATWAGRWRSDAQTAGTGDLRPGDIHAGEPGATRTWRARKAAGSAPPPPAADPAGAASRQAASEPGVAVRWLVRPLMQGARNRLEAAGILAPSAPPRSRAVMAWLRDFDTSVAAVSNDLQDAGA